MNPAVLRPSAGHLGRMPLGQAVFVLVRRILHNARCLTKGQEHTRLIAARCFVTEIANRHRNTGCFFFWLILAAGYEHIGAIGTHSILVTGTNVQSRFPRTPRAPQRSIISNVLKCPSGTQKGAKRGIQAAFWSCRTRRRHNDAWRQIR